MLKHILKYVVGAALIGAAHGAMATSFYIAAHADDIELFMARNTAYDVASGAKVVFVLTTTGSFSRNGTTGAVEIRGAGVYPGLTPPSTTPYYLTREAGHAAALATWYKQQGKTLRANSVSNVVINGRTIQRTEIGGAGSNVIMYNLRLVDGDDQDQSGLTVFRNKSLTNPSATISAVDGTATYTWDDLKLFISSLIAREQDAADTWVNIPEYWEDGVPEANYDHQDHITTARLVSHALRDYVAVSPSRCIRTLQWIGYATSSKPENYTAAEKTVQDAVWEDLNVAKVQAGGPDTRDSGHAVWLHKIYTSANGTAGVTKFGACP